MTDRARKILEGKRERALAALEDERRLKGHLVYLREDEVKILSNWLRELLNEKKG